jgi:hypothetical protein
MRMMQCSAAPPGYSDLLAYAADNARPQRNNRRV